MTIFSPTQYSSHWSHLWRACSHSCPLHTLWISSDSLQSSWSESRVCAPLSIIGPQWASSCISHIWAHSDPTAPRFGQDVLAGVILMSTNRLYDHSSLLQVTAQGLCALSEKSTKNAELWSLINYFTKRFTLLLL